MAETEQSARRARSAERLLKRAALPIPTSLDELFFSPARNLDGDMVSGLATRDWVAAGATALVAERYRSRQELPRLRVRYRLVSEGHLHPRHTSVTTNA